MFPQDICYVIKEDVKYPKVMFLPSGKGKVLKEMVEKIQNSFSDASFEFYNSTNNKEKENIIDFIQKRRNELMSKLDKMAEEFGFEVKVTNAGFAFIPVKAGEEMKEKEFDDLDEEQRNDMLNKVGTLKANAQDILEQLKDIEITELEKIKVLMKQHFYDEIKELKDEYINIFNENREIIEYLDYVCSNIEQGIIDIYSINYEEDEEKINEVICKFNVNVLVDNENNKKPLVIFEEDPCIDKLLGNIEYENHNNVYSTDVTLIKAGSLIRANEGYLIIRVNSLLSNPNAYYYLKKSLISEKVDLDYNRGYLELLSLNGLKSEPINIKDKVILIGDYETYDLLYNYDEDFKKLFPIRAEYEPVVEINETTKAALLKNIYRVMNDNKLTNIEESAVKEIAKYLSRKAEDKNKIFFDECELNKILIMSSNRVHHRGEKEIKTEDIKAVAYSEELIEKSLMESFSSKKMFISLNNKVVGMINGLSVIDSGYFSIGKPIRITCTCYNGDGNIIDVQKESNLSGSIHSKSINILRGYLSRIINSYNKLPVDFHLSFEQLYGKIDGDSASVAEIVCMISALTKLPIRQNIAVTGSINQFGEVQPIGGVNEKIEGFFKTCKAVDTVEGKGVLIPHSNKNDLVLNGEVESEIEKGTFTIYTMETVEDAIEVLIGTEKIKYEDVISIMEKEMKKYNSK
jgi:predicted ATP-dependent protease